MINYLVTSYKINCLNKQNPFIGENEIWMEKKVKCTYKFQ